MPAAPHRGAPCEVHARDGGGIQTGDAPPRTGVTHTLDGTPTVRAMPRRLPQGGGQVDGVVGLDYGVGHLSRRRPR
jgi:hypothetical protein